GEDAPPLHRAGLDRRRREIQADVGALLPLLGGDEDTVPDDDQALRRLVRHGAEYTTSPGGPGTPGASALGARWRKRDVDHAHRLTGQGAALLMRACRGVAAAPPTAAPLVGDRTSDSASPRRSTAKQGPLGHGQTEQWT